MAATGYAADVQPDDILIDAVALIGVTFLDKLWDELEYHLDVCCITNGSHIEHL
jgi:hypothetical protein